ncbi:polypeptide N-acetylgalactosaminyltransferase 11-like [Diadema antillarum]|uniref:polypeptide N-acetylgalactosaminyltransferase 11-like n=1 Tax=Diadema antillarum TaxID=105358 RepID=UPI003A859006
MSNIRLVRCFCYGISLSSVIWLLLIYLFLTEVGKDNLEGLPNGRLASSHRLRPVKMIANPHPGVRSFHVGGVLKNAEGEEWRQNNLVIQDKDAVDANRVRLVPRIPKPLPDAADKSDHESRQQGKAPAAGAVARVDLDLKGDEIGLVRNDLDRKTRDNGYRQHAFNELISNRIGFHRNLTDPRNPLCKYQVYSDDLPSTSIIICFFNEAWTTLLRTVYSVLDRTPRRLLHEIILVDDSSELSHLHDNLDDFVRENFGGLVRVIHNTRREGLIRARMIGARNATGEVLMFLDSHCEVNEQWLEPLLERIQADSHTVVCPIIDIINADSFVYTASPLVRGGFNWGMHFKWDPIPSSQFAGKEDYIKPIQSPTMAGGLFAMKREYFHYLGEYDDGMDVWGGENLEISFRIWQCGGKLEIMPCSRVGHVFRKRRPYGSPGNTDTTTRNAARVAHVWMDEYKEHFFKVQPKARTMDYGDVSSRLELRKKLQCESFKWYLDTVYPEMKTPDGGKGQVNKAVEGMQRRVPPKSVRKGKLRHISTGLCLVSKTKIITKGSELILGDCFNEDSKMVMWYQSSIDEFKLADTLCMDMAESNSASVPHLRKCDGMGGSQRWLFTKGQIYQPVSGLCLSVQQAGSVYTSKLEICNGTPVQMWEYRFKR